MNPDDIKLETLEKVFEYEKLSRDVDKCSNLNDLKNIAKSFMKLYLKQQETVTFIIKRNGKTL